MKYRAELVGVPNLARTVQTVSQHLHVVRRWANEALKPYAAVVGARVDVWEVEERLVGTVAYEPKLDEKGPGRITEVQP